MAKDRWPELCKQVSQDDGLPTREVGHWSEEKLFFWNRYAGGKSVRFRFSVLFT